MLGSENKNKFSDSELIWVFNRSRGQCLYCGRDISFHAYEAFGQRGAWVVDRFIPMEKGGPDQIFNWVASCPACSYDKAGQLPWEYAPQRFSPGEINPETAVIRFQDQQSGDRML